MEQLEKDELIKKLKEKDKELRTLSNKLLDSQK